MSSIKETETTTLSVLVNDSGRKMPYKEYGFHDLRRNISEEISHTNDVLSYHKLILYLSNIFKVKTHIHCTKLKNTK